MNWQASLARVLRGLKNEEERIERELGDVRAKLAALGGLAGGKRGAGKAKVRRKLSPKARAAISRAAKKRWAKYRADKGTAS